MENKYFASKEANKVSSYLLGRVQGWTHNLESNGYLNKLRDMWAAYHGAYYDNEGHRLTFGGEQGEIVNMPVNHLRNIAQHMLVMTTSNRPSMDARAVNTDAKSLTQTILANGLLDYYMREKRLERYLKTATEYAVVFGAGYVKMSWNATIGDIAEHDEETGEIIHDGDVEFSNLSPFDIVFDSNKENAYEHDWYLTRTYKNKYDLAAKYPELADKLIALQTKSDIYKYRLTFQGGYDETDDIEVYEFYHKKTESMPNGRYMLFVAADIVLLDTKMPYRMLPIFRISAGDILGTPYGYTSLYDILPIQEGVNALYTTILTNQNAFGVQNVYVPRGSDLDFNTLAGGLNVIEGNAKPEPINLTNTPQEVFKFLEILERVMETLSGVNSVARGNPEASLRSGNALALVQSMALQFISGLQESYVQLIEDVGTALIKMLQDFAHTPRVAAIVGKSNRTYLKEFSSSDISAINRVVVDVGNPLSRCLAKDTPVLMYDGSIKMVQNIKVDDLIMGPDSGPRTVESTASGQEAMYEVTSKDPHRNIKYGCNESHILTLKYCSDDYRYDAKQGDILDISIREYNKLTLRQKRMLQGFTTRIDFEKKNLPIPAYILGAWLGDGHSATTALTSMDPELVESWEGYASSLGLKVRVQENRQPNKSKVYFITSGESHGASDRNAFKNELNRLELINNKHIPQMYLRTSIQDRLELLAGLLDTDGHRIDETFIFIQKNERLSIEVVHLAKSLGFRVTCKKVKASSSKLVGELDSEVYKISIGGDTWEIPTKLPRKQAKKKEKARDPLNYGIDVKYVGEGTYYGFTLKEEPHFVLGDFTVTHNTTAGRVQMAEQLLQMGAVKNPQQYFQVINTGRLDTMYEGDAHELILIRLENEDLMAGKQIFATAIDAHRTHILEHKALAADPEVRRNPELMKGINQHIQDHIDLLKNTDPNLLMLIGEQPLQGPPPAPPGGPNAPEGPGAPQGNESVMAAPGQGPGEQPGDQQIQGPGMEQPVNLPKPSQVNPALLANPNVAPPQNPIPH